MRLIWGFSVLYVLGSAGLWFAAPGDFNLVLTLACFGLGAFLVATHAPLIHAAAHIAHEQRDHTGVGHEQIEHQHGEIHHPSLHDVCVKPLRGNTKATLPEPRSKIEIIPPLPERPAPSRPDPVSVSRAPPAGDPARAPPSV